MIKLGLEATGKSLLKISNQSQPIVHIAGTNGKGSTSAFIDGLLRSLDYKVGRFNSPHLVEEFDSLIIQGKPISSTVYYNLVHQLETQDDNYKKLTNFEKLTVSAFNLFSQQEIDVGIIEVGMGGLLDATNAFSRESRDSIAVITPIALDHISWLGDNIIDITKQKIGIITSKTKAAIVAPQIHHQVIGLIRERCEELKVPVYFNDRPGELVNPINGDIINAQLRMAGKHQIENASTALLAVHALQKHCEHFKAIDLSANNEISNTLNQVSFHGRSDRDVLPGVIVDGAHNPAAMQLLRDTLSEDQAYTFILGFSQDKDVDDMLRILIRARDTVIFVPFSSIPSMPWVKNMNTTTLKAKTDELFENSVDVGVSNNLPEALQLAGKSGKKVVITGSLYLIADVYRL